MIFYLTPLANVTTFRILQKKFIVKELRDAKKLAAADNPMAVYFMFIIF